MGSELRWIAVLATLSLRRRSRERLAWALAAALAAATVGGLGWALHLGSALREASRPFRADVVSPPELPL